jgi:hypothetical protein
VILLLALNSHEKARDRGWAFIAADADRAGLSALVDA